MYISFFYTFNLLVSFSGILNGGNHTSNAGTCAQKREMLQKIMLHVQELEMRNMDLERRVQSAEQSLASTLEDRDRTENEVQRVIQILDVKLFDLSDLRQSLVKLLEK